MVRKLKYHEKKLLKKVDFLNWEADNNIREVKVMRKFHVQKREDYSRYNELVRAIRALAKKIKELDQNDPFRSEASAQLLEKLYIMGLIPSKSDLALCNHVNVASFCRRRLPSILVKSRMAERIKMAVQLIEQGHVRVGAEVVKDPAFLVTRNLEDFVTWVDTSAIKKHIKRYNDEYDDFEM